MLSQERIKVVAAILSKRDGTLYQFHGFLQLNGKMGIRYMETPGKGTQPGRCIGISNEEAIELYHNNNKGDDTMETDRIEKAINDLENFPLTEDQQSLVNYLRSNIDDIGEALAP